MIFSKLAKYYKIEGIEKTQKHCKIFILISSETQPYL